MPNKGSRKKTDFVRHFFSFDTWKQTFLSNTVLRIACSINAQDWLTGKTSISGICPQMLDPAPPKADKKRTVLPNFVYSRTHGTPSGPNNAFHVPSPDAMQRHRINLLCIFNAKKRNLRFIRENSALIIQMFLILQRLRNKEHFETYSWLVIPRRPSCDP